MVDNGKQSPMLFRFRYLNVENHSDEHKILVFFILKSYMPVWFRIMKSNCFIDDNDHIFKVKISARFLPNNLVGEFNPVFK